MYRIGDITFTKRSATEPRIPSHCIIFKFWNLRWKNARFSPVAQKRKRQHSRPTRSWNWVEAPFFSWPCALLGCTRIKSLHWLYCFDPFWKFSCHFRRLNDWKCVCDKMYPFFVYFAELVVKNIHIEKIFMV